jgi:hypothetical protein
VPFFYPVNTIPFFSGAINSHDWELELKIVVAAIYTNYTTKIIDDMDMEHLGGYFSGPKGQKLILQFERAE